MTKKQLQSQIDDLKQDLKFLRNNSNDSIRNINKMLLMLKDYLRVKEEDYAEIEDETSIDPYYNLYRTGRKIAVKRTRLIPIKKGKKL